MSVVYALDVSSSIDPAFVATAIDWIASTNAQGDPAHAAFIAFGGSARAVATVEGIRSVEVSADGANRSINQSVTNLEAAVTRAFRSFDPRYLKRLVLITDGNENAGNVSRVLGEAQENDVRVFTLPATVRGEGDTWIEAIDLPDEIREQEPVTATVRVFSRVATTTTVSLVGDDQTLETREVRLEPGLNEVDFEVRLPAGGAGTLSGRLQSENDPFAQNDLHTQAISVGARPRILYVEGRLASARYLADALSSEGMDVAVVGPESLPETTAALESFDLVLLSDVPMDALGLNQVNALLGYVRDSGGGFIFAAGESSYGEEGYAGSEIEELLPIWFELNKERKELALVIVLDKSYSMVGPKLELSKEAAKAALDLLQPTQSFGLITFDDTPYVTVPLQLAVEKARINDFISRIIAGSQTNIFPALETAFAALEESEAEIRHIILLSDGKDLCGRLRATRFVDGRFGHNRFFRCGGPGGGQRTAREYCDLGKGAQLLHSGRRARPANLHPGNPDRFTVHACRGGRRDYGSHLDRGLHRHRPGCGAASSRLREDFGEGDRRGAHPIRFGEPTLGAVAVWIGQDRCFHVGRQEPLGRRLADVGRVWKVLVTTCPRNDET